jgi:hypothetical protein
MWQQCNSVSVCVAMHSTQTSRFRQNFIRLKSVFSAWIERVVCLCTSSLALTNAYYIVQRVQEEGVGVMNTAVLRIFAALGETASEHETRS